MGIIRKLCDFIDSIDLSIKDGVLRIYFELGKDNVVNIEIKNRIIINC